MIQSENKCGILRREHTSCHFPRALLNIVNLGRNAWRCDCARLLVVLLSIVVLHLDAAPGFAGSSLPHDPSQLLLIGDSVTAGIYFLSIDEVTMRQAWSGQLVRRLGIDPPRAPYQQTYPINHLGLAQLGFTIGGVAYVWEARHIVRRGSPQFKADEERVVLAVPGQTLHEVLTQSSRTNHYNDHSSGWTFANILLPKGLTAIETVEQWKKRPEWVVVFIGANDLLASFGIVGDALPPSPEAFATEYGELVTRLRNRMAPDAASNQFFVLTLPDVTHLPFLQPVPEKADNGKGVHFPAGSMASAFLIPFRKHFQDDEVWTPEELDVIRKRAQDYNEVIRKIATANGLTVIDIEGLMEKLRQDPAFSSAASPYFSPDLHHPSFRTHALIADLVLDEMSRITGETAPALVTTETPLPHAGDFSSDRYQTRVAALMHLGLLGLQCGPLPPRITSRLGVETAGQVGNERIGDATVSLLAGVEFPPLPDGTAPLVRFCVFLRAAALAFNGSDQEVEYFPQRSLEARLGFAREPIAAWTWARFEFGGLLTLDNEWDAGLYARGEWRGLYAEVAGRGWWFDRVEAGFRFGLQPGRPGRNGD
jgi:lysophospholipase L1-like esterase